MPNTTGPAGRVDVRHHAVPLFGSDRPYLPEPLIAQVAAGVAGYDGFGPAARALVERGNALRLFLQLAARLGAAERPSLAPGAPV